MLILLIFDLIIIISLNFKFIENKIEFQKNLIKLLNQKLIDCKN